MLDNTREPVGQEFSRLYRAEIQHRKFVEEPDYYHNSEERFWQGFRRIQDMTLPPGSKVLDIGGGMVGTSVQASGFSGHGRRRQ